MTVAEAVPFAASWVAGCVAVVRIVNDWNRGDPVAAVDAGLLGLVAAYVALIWRWPVAAVVWALYAGFEFGCHVTAQRCTTATSAARVYDHEDEPSEES